MLQAHGLTKRYGGLLALDRVSFELHPGEIVGYLGPNGSGKSTTVNLVVGYSSRAPATSRSVRSARPRIHCVQASHRICTGGALALRASHGVGLPSCWSGGFAACQPARSRHVFQSCS